MFYIEQKEYSGNRLYYARYVLPSGNITQWTGDLNHAHLFKTYEQAVVVWENIRNQRLANPANPLSICAYYPMPGNQ